MTRYLLIIMLTAFVFSFSGCKKKSGFDPMSKGASDFVGTWQGAMTTFKNNKLLKVNSDVMFYRISADNLDGIVFMNQSLVFHEFQFLNGTLYFRVECNDPQNSTCQAWNLSGYAIFAEATKINIRISGNECGPFGSEYVEWNGTLVKTQVPADSLPYNYFGKATNTWTYKTSLKQGDTCQVQKQIMINPAYYQFEGASSQTCGLSWALQPFKWNISPAQFTINNDTTLCLHPFTFSVNAKAGVVYSTILYNDTTTVTLVDTNLTVTTPAGSFLCRRFKYTEPVGLGASRITRTAWLWLNYKYGIIRQEVVNPVDSTDLKTQELISKTF